MAKGKTAKVSAAIEKARIKLAQQQAKIKSLENKHTELENMDIVDIVRGMKIPLNELAAVLQLVKSEAALKSPRILSQLDEKLMEENDIYENDSDNMEDIDKEE